MNIVEKAKAAAAALSELADALSRGDHLQPQTASASPPSAYHPPVPTRSDARVPFGRAVGKLLTEVDVAQLQWLASALEKSISDPSKAAYAGKNQKDLAEVRAELQRRHP